MIIDEITLHNYGVYKDRQTVDLCPPSEKKSIILFGGQNGGGKTTLLDALQLVLYGRFSQCSNRGNFAYEDYLRRCINNSVNPRDGASIELQFRVFSSGKQRLYRICRSWRQNGAGIREDLDVLKDGVKDRVLEDSWNQYVEEFIPLRIFNLFFFDGEKIERFVNIENTKELLSTAFRSLLGLEITEQLSSDLIVLERRKKTLLKNQSEQNQISLLDDELKELRNRKDIYIQDRAGLQNEYEQIQKQIGSIIERFRNAGGDLYERRDVIEAERGRARECITAAENELVVITEGPLPLSIVRDYLESLVKQHAIEKHARIASAVNETLADRDVQLINHLHQNGAPSEIIASLEAFLTRDMIVRNMHGEAECYLSLEDMAYNSLLHLRATVLPEEILRCSKLMKEIRESQHSYDDLDRKLASVPEYEVIAGIIEEKKLAESEAQAVQNKMDALDDELSHLRRDIELKEGKIRSLIEKSVETDFKREDLSRIIYHSQKVRNTMTEFRSSIVKHHIDRLSEFILDSFQRLIRKKSLISRLEIDPDSFHIEFRDVHGESLQTDRISAGERQLLAISILWGLARASGRPLPVAIDTPLGRLDGTHRSHLIERYFPHASHQVFLFSTDEEISKKYFEKLKPYIGRSYLLNYSDSSHSTVIQKGYF